MPNKIFKIEDVSSEDFLKSLKQDELAIVISTPKKLGSFAESLKKTSIPALQRKVHSLLVHGGFTKNANALYLCPEFLKTGNNTLEERWVFNEWVKTLQSNYAPRKIAVYLDEGCTSTDLIRVEDMYTAFSTPTYTGSKWQEFRVCTKNSKVITDIDPHYSTRFSYQLNYRKWINENPDSLTSIEIGNRLKSFATNFGCTFKTFDESMLKEQNMNLLLGVGQGAVKSPSRMHILEHKLTPGCEPIVLVGKGITFDSGGINLKPHESFVNCMKNDMGGAALFSSLFMGLVEKGYEQPLVLVIPCCENAIDANSLKPGDIVKSRSGKDVIIEHTDAEGRLILADAMSYAFDTYKPRQLFTAATLTTASLRQFGNYFTPIHFASQKFQEQMEISANLTGEAFTFWQKFLPFLQGNKTNAADLTNMGRLASHASMGSGSNVAAHFLNEFASGPYTHLDIFNTVWNWSQDYPGAHYGATGSVFNSLWISFQTGF